MKLLTMKRFGRLTGYPLQVRPPSYPPASGFPLLSLPLLRLIHGFRLPPALLTAKIRSKEKLGKRDGINPAGLYTQKANLFRFLFPPILFPP